MDYNYLTSNNWYNKTYSHYGIFFGKIATQELHLWYHGGNNSGQAKWIYGKDYSDYWTWFSEARNNPTSTGEKIVSWISSYGTTGSTDQIWAY